MLPFKRAQKLPSCHRTLGLFWNHLGLRETPSHTRGPGHKEEMAYLNTQGCSLYQINKILFLTQVLWSQGAE